MSKECRDIKELHPKVKELAILFENECHKRGINIKIGETYRSVDRQDYLYAQGRTRPGSIVTYARGRDMESYHQWRLAFDVFINEKGNEYNTSLLNRAGAVGRELGLEWGGDFSGFKDTPHFQYTEGLSIKDLKSGKSIKGGEFVPDKIKVEINGKAKEVNAVNVNGNHYVKMQDLNSDKIVVSHKQGMPVITTK